MRTMLMSAAIATTIAGGAAMAPREAPQVRPGELTKGEVWIQNPGRSEAVPVSVQELASDQTPVRVLVTNGSATGSPPVAVRAVPPTWEYRIQNVSLPADPSGATTALNQLGQAGWETTGIVWAGPQNSLQMLMKRQR